MKGRKISIFFLIAVFAFVLAFSAVWYLDIPSQLVKFEQNTKNGGLDTAQNIEANDSGVLKDGIYKNGEKTSYTQNANNFGILNIKKQNSDLKNKKVVACGNSIGVKLYTDGVLVVDITDVTAKDGKKISPAKNAGIKTGDFIRELNGDKITNIDSLKTAVEKLGENKAKIVFVRDGKIKESAILPVKSADDNTLKLGMWVKDSTAGIGTMTFYDKETKTFGALGHGISSEGGVLMPHLKGSIVKSSIIDVKKGKSGEPGELQGLFLGGDSKIGSITKNIKYGIFGTVEKDTNIPQTNEFFVASASEITQGEAYILSNISGDEVKEYKVEIQKVMLHNENSTKGMVIKVTDENLINLTGGIVQGMSGSPIIQNGKLIGAVTHVFVNDPTKGYGIFIETMLNNCA